MSNKVIDPADYADQDMIPLRLAAQLYYISEAALTKYFQSGRIVSEKQGRHRMVSRASIDAYIATSDVLDRIAVNGLSASKRGRGGVVLPKRKRPCVGCTLLVDVPEKYCRFCIADGKV